MLVVVWDGMNDAISRIQAENNLNAYNVAVLATPVADNYAAFKRQQVIDRWVELSEPRKRVREVDLHQLRDLLVGAFQEQIRS